LPFYKITFNTSNKINRACIYNQGCNFRCRGCVYKLKPSIAVKEEQGLKLEMENIKTTLGRLKPKRVHFLGGEPTTNPLLPQLAEFAHEELGAVTQIGHTNGSGWIPNYVDKASFSIKARSPSIHKKYTGASNAAVLRNFADAYHRGVVVTASSVLIPGIIGAEEVGRVAEYVGELDRHIPFHIIAYMPVPGAPYFAPTTEEIREAKDLSKQYLDKVTYSAMSVENYFDLLASDQSYQSVQVA
jgi:pyruvate formate lyase activating enzyme